MPRPRNLLIQSITEDSASIFNILYGCGVTTTASMSLDTSQLEFVSLALIRLSLLFLRKDVNNSILIRVYASKAERLWMERWAWVIAQRILAVWINAALGDQNPYGHYQRHGENIFRPVWENIIVHIDNHIPTRFGFIIPKRLMSLAWPLA